MIQREKLRQPLFKKFLTITYIHLCRNVIRFPSLLIFLNAFLYVLINTFLTRHYQITIHPLRYKYTFLNHQIFENSNISILVEKKK